MKEGPEEGDKKEHFGADEQHHTQSYSPLHFPGVLPLKGRFPGYIPPPLYYSCKNEGQARSNQSRVIFVGIGSQAGHQAEAPDGAGKRSWAKIDEMEGVFGHGSPQNEIGLTLHRGTPYGPSPKSPLAGRGVAPRRRTIKAPPLRTHTSRPQSIWRSDGREVLPQGR